MTLQARQPSAGLPDTVTALIRDVPDFPRAGILFKDICPLLADPVGFAAVVDAFAHVARAAGAQLIAGVEARGFLFAAPTAFAAGVGVLPVRKAGKLPGPTHAASYALEYGEATLEVGASAVPPGVRVLLVDDVLATGGTLAAAAGLLRLAGAEVVAVAVLLELGALGGRAAIESLAAPMPVIALQTV